MDIYEYLKLDHEQVNKLFKQFEDTTNKNRQVQIISLLIQELLVHAKSEEETFYKILEQYCESEKKVLHGRKEHKEIKQQIEKILNTKPTDKHWMQVVKHLNELVTHHVKEEEGSIFKKAKKVLPELETYRLKEQMHTLKQKYLRRLEKELKVA